MSLKMSGSPSDKSWLKALLLLCLFTVGLILQASHQFNTPAPDSVDCGTSKHHFHADPDNHHCDLCDFKLTATQQTGVVFMSVIWLQDRSARVILEVALNDLVNFTARGPPQV